jgi:hypothetical protein
VNRLCAYALAVGSATAAVACAATIAAGEAYVEGPALDASQLVRIISRAEVLPERVRHPDVRRTGPAALSRAI